MHRRKLRYTLSASNRAAEAGPPPSPAAGAPRVLSVGELTRGVRRVLESAFSEVAVHGEVVGVSRPRSGHVYFNLRDDGASADAQIAVVVWRDDAARIAFPLADGQRIIVRGRVTVYEPRGCYQIIAERVEADGAGALALAFERLKSRLALEGLFAPERKRPLPFLPERIGVVTSLSGAALQDILRSIHRRHPRAWVRIVAVRVQGEGAAEEVAAALRFLGRAPAPVEVVIVGRGGGSPEDLWTFNDERVVRAVAECGVPVVSAVGHEVDFTLCDFAADVRAQTPTHAGDLVVPHLEELGAALSGLGERLRGGLQRRVRSARDVLDRFRSSRALGVPQDIVLRRAQGLDELSRAFEKTLYTNLRRWHDRLVGLRGSLEALSPLQVLRRGYAVVFDSRGRVARRAADLSAGESIRILLGEGRAEAKVDQVPVCQDQAYQDQGSPDRDADREEHG